MPNARTWTPVTDSLPDADTTVTVGNAEWDDPVWMGYHDGVVWRSIDGTRLDGYTHPEANFLPPTHWQPLSEPPPRINEAKGGN